MKRLVLILFSAAVFLYSVSVSAQALVKLRSGVHEDYTRIVFDLPAPAQHEVTRDSDNTLTVTLLSSDNYQIDKNDFDAQGSIESLQSLDQSAGSLAVTFETDKRRDFRSFVIGNRVIVDILGTPPASPSQRDAAPAAPEKKPNQDTKTAEPVSKQEQKPRPSQKNTDKTVKVVQVDIPEIIIDGDGNTTERMITKTQISQSANAAPSDNYEEPTQINLSLTEAVGIAVFKRGGGLYYFVDTVLQVSPRFKGPLADRFKPFEKVETNTGTLYYTEIPEDFRDYHFYAEGGGLVWRVVMQQQEPPFPAVEPQTIFSKSDTVRNSTVLWPLKKITGIFTIRDPKIGDELVVAAVSSAEQYTGGAYDYVDFDTMYTAAGLVVKPENDALVVEMEPLGINISLEQGLALSSRKDASIRKMRENVRDSSKVDEQRIVDATVQAQDVKNEKIVQIFDFDRWMLGGKRMLEENQRILLTAASTKDSAGKAQDLVTLAKMNLSNNRGQEAVGFLKHAAYIYPAVVNSVEYRALRGASYAISGKYEFAFQDLFHSSLEGYSELDYWRAYTLASLEDWRQARDYMPEDMFVLMDYPNDLLQRIGLKLAEVALRHGDIVKAERVLSSIKTSGDDLWPSTRSNAAYLKGVAHSISSEFERAKEFWQPLISGPDDLFRAKAGLAMTMMKLSREEISEAEAIDRLEGLRYAWRGDELEAQINFMLGRLYINQKSYMRGFTILRDAASLRPDANVSQDITDFMKDKFEDILINDTELSALDAVSVFEDFRELTPPGETGDIVIQRLAERLVEAELLGRAAALLQNQVDFRLSGENRAATAIRLGTVYLLDQNPEDAMKALNIAKDIRMKDGSSKSDDDLLEVEMLIARALSQDGKAEEAIDILDRLGTAEVINRLRADIAWKAGLWQDAADAINLLILDEAIAPGDSLTGDQAELILNRAVVLNLAGDRVELANLSTRFGDQMQRTSRARLFDVITRQRQNSIIADQTTLRSLVNEVDMFKEFLIEYNKTSTPSPFASDE